MRFHCLQHVNFETPGTILTWIEENQHSIRYTKFFEDPSLPSSEEFDTVLIMGGHMSVHDEKDFPWLFAEKQFVANAIREKKKIIGICLGSQIIASVLGAKVYPNQEKEIGFMPIQYTEAARQHPFFSELQEEPTVFHWHGETFDLPKEAILLASSGPCLNQAFLIGESILGIQFHLEATSEIIREMLAHGQKELVSGSPYIHPAEKIEKELTFLEFGKNQLFSLLYKFFNNPI